MIPNKNNRNKFCLQKFKMEKISTVSTQHLFIKKYDDLQLAVFPGCQIESLEINFELYCASLLESGKNWIITQASAGNDL
jgi:hypothetical protein